MPVKFDGIAGPAAAKIQIAFGRLPACLAACTQALTPGHINWPAYKYWLDNQGNAAPANVAAVRQVFATVSTWVATKTFTFVNVGGSQLHHAIPGLCAYVMAATPHMMAGGGLGSSAFAGVEHVGSGVRIMLPPSTTANSNELIKTLFHEITHKIGQRIVDTQPNPYNPAACHARAQNNPAQALRNAENYTLFFGEINNL